MTGDMYDSTITMKKFFFGLGLALGITGIDYLLDYLGTASIPPEYIALVGFVYAICIAAQNFIKHYQDTSKED